MGYKMSNPITPNNKEIEKAIGNETPFSIFHFKSTKIVMKRLNKISISSDNPSDVKHSNQFILVTLANNCSSNIMSNPPLWFQDTQFEDMQKILLNLAKDKSLISL